MEIEMKYRVPEGVCGDRIWEDESLLKICEFETREAVQMKAAYFDTEDRILQKNCVAFRVRAEGPKTVATLKWAGRCTEGLHMREEVNVPVSGADCMLSPTAEIFRESEAGKFVLELLGDKTLQSLLEMRFLRRRMRVDTGKSICEVALDTGEIVTDYGTVPICELEIELYSGEQEDVLALGEDLASRYGLTAENESKYARGLAVIPQMAEQV